MSNKISKSINDFSLFDEISRIILSCRRLPCLEKIYQHPTSKHNLAFTLKEQWNGKTKIFLENFEIRFWTLETPLDKL